MVVKLTVGSWGDDKFSIKRHLANNPHASYRIWVFNPTDTNIKTHMQMDFHCQASGVFNQTKASCTYDSKKMIGMNFMLNLVISKRHHN